MSDQTVRCTHVMPSARGRYIVHFSDRSWREVNIKWPHYHSDRHEETVRVYNALPDCPSVIFQPEPIDEEEDECGKHPSVS